MCKTRLLLFQKVVTICNSLETGNDRIFIHSTVKGNQMRKEADRKTNQQPRRPAGAPQPIGPDSSETGKDRASMFGTKLPQPTRQQLEARNKRKEHYQSKLPTSPSSASSASVGELGTKKPKTENAGFFTRAQVKGPVKSSIKVTPEKTYAEAVKASAPK